MIKIDRSCSQRIITTALKHPESALFGLLDAQGHHFTRYPDHESLLDALSQQEGAIIVHNQHPQALSAINAMPLSDAQQVIEIREDTKGVLGLQATRHGDHTDIPMEW